MFVILAVLAATGGNRFPYYHHADEPSKVRQIAKKERNFHHPLLLLTSVQVARKVLETGRRFTGLRGPDRKLSRQQIAILGRSFSAGFAAGCVLLLAWLAWRTHGPVAGLAVGFALATLPPLAYQGHFFKEDTALVFGLGAAAAALGAFLEKPGRASAALLGLALAVCASGKYIGVLFIPIVLILSVPGWMLLRNTSDKKTRMKGIGICVAALIGSLLCGFFLLNARLILSLPEFLSGLGREWEGVTEGHHGLQRQVPHAVYLQTLIASTPALAWCFLCAFPIAWRRGGKAGGALPALTVFLVAYLILISYSPKLSPRYVLPLQVGIVFGAAVAWAVLWNLSDSRRVGRVFRFLLGCAAIIFLHGQSMRILHMQRDFEADPRKEIMEWLRTNTAYGTRVAQMSSRYLPDATHVEPGELPVDFEVITRPDLDVDGTLDALRETGASFLLVSRKDYGRYISRRVSPTKDVISTFQSKRAFYTALEQEATLVKSTSAGPVGEIQQPLQLWKIRPLPPVNGTE